MAKFSGLWTLSQQAQAVGNNLWPQKPGAPTIGTATAGNAQASITFTAPTNLGVPAVITSYTATSSPGGITGSAASSPITVTGLTNGQAYTFTVTATNASGTGPASAASNSVTPSSAPAAVSFVWLTTAPSNTNMTYTNGNRTATNGGNTNWYQTALAALPTTSGGKYYWEVTETISNQYANLGVGNQTTNDNFYTDNSGPRYVLRSEDTSMNLATWSGVTGSGTLTTYQNNNVRFGYAYDVDSRKLWVRQNGGAWIGGGDPASGTTPSVTTSGTTYFVGNTYNTNDQSFTITLRSAQVDTPPSGFTAIGGTV